MAAIGKWWAAGTACLMLCGCGGSGTSTDQVQRADPPPSSGQSSPSSSSTVDTVLDGTYRTTATAAAFRRAGATDTDAINENAGRFTVTLRSGDWAMVQRYNTGPKKGQLWKGSGNYTLEGKWFVWTWSTDPGDWSAAKVVKRPDGSLSFTRHADGDGPAELALTKVMFRRWAPARSAD